MPTSLLLSFLANANGANAIRQEKKEITINVTITMQKKKARFYFVHDFLGQEFREGSSGQFFLRISPMGTIRCQKGL